MTPEDSTAAEPSASEGGSGAPPHSEQPNRAPDLTREYSTAAITVEWYAERCIHSAYCVRALRQVFDPARRPWVDVHAAPADDIAAAVLQCPSGALHFTRHDGGADERAEVPTTVTATRTGALFVRGDVEAHDTNGAPLRHDTRMALCGCRESHRLPFCDNSCRAPAPHRAAASTHLSP